MMKRRRSSTTTVFRDSSSTTTLTMTDPLHQRSALWRILLAATLVLLSFTHTSANVERSVRGGAAASSTTAHQNDDESQEQHRDLIVNGNSVTSLREYQFFARSWPDSVRQTLDYLCGASLIHSDMLLTAAHCHGAFNYGVMMFNPYLDTLTWYRTIDQQIAHPDYFSDIALINNDVMLLRLSEPITEIVPVRLNNDPDFPLAGRDVTHATGFGVTDYAAGTVSSDLQVGYFLPITNTECSTRGRFVNVALSSDIMCVDPLSDESVCGGDSGGPLTVPLVKVSEQQGAESGSSTTAADVTEDGATAIQVGVISFGTDCQADNVPDGMARVSYFYDWIQEQICRHSRRPSVGCPTLTDSEESSFFDQNAVTIELDFHHDFLAEQTTFSVRELSTNEVKHVGPEYVPRRGEEVVSTFSLFPGSYVFEVYDVGGDGLVNPSYISASYPSGSWTLTAVYSNGGRVELASGDEAFEHLQTTNFEVPDSQPPSEAVLTDAPSISPTIFPFVATATPTISVEQPTEATTEPNTETSIEGETTSSGTEEDAIVANSGVGTHRPLLQLWTILPALVGVVFATRQYTVMP